MPDSTLRVLITGATGLLGRALMAEMSRSSLEVVGTGLRRARGAIHRLDLLDPAAVKRFVESRRPAVIVHAAAERRPDVGERDPDLVRALNVDATRTILDAAGAVGARVIYLSTDYVFDGTSPPYRPEATPNPLNLYGRSKLAGEELVRAAEGHCVLRVPLLFGPVESLEESPVTSIAKEMLGEGPVTLDHWATRYPTSTGDVAFVCRQLVERRREAPTLAGTFHWSGDEALTKYEMGRAVAEEWGLDVRLIPDARPPSGAARPRNSRLDCSGLERLAIGRRTPFRVSLRASLAPFRP